MVSRGDVKIKLVSVIRVEIVLPVGVNIDEMDNEFGTITKIEERYWLTFKA